jgi:6-phosphogluconolactonase (cycloisomerase 2 family)
MDATGKPTPGAQLFTGTGQDLAVDSTGKFLLVVDNTGVVHVFAINFSNGSMSQIGTSEAAGNGAVGISIDPSGHFVLVSQSASSTNLPGAANQITVFTFDPGTGAMKKLQSYPQPKAPGAMVMIAR